MSVFIPPICAFESQQVGCKTHSQTGSLEWECRNSAALNPMALNMPLISGPINHGKQGCVCQPKSQLANKPTSQAGRTLSPIRQMRCMPRAQIISCCMRLERDPEAITQSALQICKVTDPLVLCSVIAKSCANLIV